MSAYLSRVLSSKSFMSLRHIAKEVARHFPKPLEDAARRAEEYARGFVTGGTLFEELGFYYVGPIDGHNIDHLLPVLKNVRDSKEPGPVLIHAVTEKGHGYLSAEQAEDKWHSVAKFDIVTGAQVKSKSTAPSYTSVFAKSLIKEAEADDRIVAITAAMPSGTGLNLFGDKFPKRCFEVGIAEQHAVTFAAGLAAEGMKPFAAIYSTFLQRAFDQVVHDVAIQKLPVRFAIDRAGLVGNDGQTLCGLVRCNLSRLPARFHNYGGGRRSRPFSHGGDLRGDRRRTLGGALSARRRHRRAAAGTGCAARNRPRPHHARGH